MEFDFDGGSNNHKGAKNGRSYTGGCSFMTNTLTIVGHATIVAIILSIDKLWRKRNERKL